MFLHDAKTGGGSTNPVAQLTHSSPTCSDLQPKKLHEGHTMTWLHTCIEGLRLPHVHVGNMLHATQMNIAAW